MHSRKERNLILDPGEFYILASKEAVQVRSGCAAVEGWFAPRCRAKVGRPKDPQKSRLTNATVLLADGDGRTTVARRYRDKIGRAHV